MSDTRPVRQQVVDFLRDEILALRFTPGEKLVERRLCEMTGASRTALREGLRQLEAEGLIEIIPNRGPIVPKLNTETRARHLSIAWCPGGGFGQAGGAKCDGP
jgi:Transcriptional regulators